MNPSRPAPANDDRASAGAEGSSLTGEATAANVPAGPPQGLEFLAPPQQADEIGRLGKYRILGQLGAGGMGMVFRAEDPSLRRAVALKVMLPQVAANPLAKARFLREARAQAKVEHVNIIQIHQIGEDRGIPFLAMPLLKGQTLQAALKQNARPPIAEVLRIGREMAEGLAAAHEHHLVHRDIKPPNIWLEGAKRRVKILDFGLARAETDVEMTATGDNEPVTRDGAILGTPAYMSPEQARGDRVDARTDLFSLGVVLYQMATGELPFKGANTMAILMSLGVDTPAHPCAKNPDVPPALGNLIVRLLAKPATERPASAEAVAEEIAQIEAGALPSAVAAPVAAGGHDPWADIDSTDPIEAPPLAAVEAPHANRQFLYMGGGVVALLIVVGAFFAFTGSDPKPPPPVAPASPVAAVPATTARPRLPAGTTDLLPLVDPRMDSVRGQWSRNGEDIFPSKEGKASTLQLPYQPPEEYDVTAELTPQRLTTPPILLSLVHGGRPFAAGIGFNEWGRGVIYSLGEGTAIRAMPPGSRLEAGKRATLRVEVRTDRITILLDDVPVQELTNRFDQLQSRTDYQMRDPLRLGLIVGSSEVTFHSVRVRDVTGKGRVVKEDSEPTRLSPEQKAIAWVLNLGGKVRLSHGPGTSGTAITTVGEWTSDSTFHEIVLGANTPPDLDGIEEAFAGVLPERWDTYAILYTHARCTDEGVRRLAGLPMAYGARVVGLFGPKITDAVLPLMSGATKLVNLDVGGTAVTGVGFPHLQDYPALRSLRVALCPLDAARFDALADLPLRSLKIDGIKRLDDSWVPALSRITTLTDINAAGTSLSAEGVQKLASALPNCSINSPHGMITGVKPILSARPALRKLHAAGAVITVNAGYKPAELTDPNSPNANALIQSLAFEAPRTNFTDQADPAKSKAGEEIAEMLTGVPAVAWYPENSRLRLNVPITPAGWKALAGSPSLRWIKEITFGYNVGNDDALAALAALPRIEMLDIRRSNQLTDAGLKSIARMTHLRSLTIDQSAVTDAGVAAISGLKLEKLALTKNAITDASVEPLSRMTTLKHLDLRNTRITPEGTAKLTAALPGCTIIWK